MKPEVKDVFVRDAEAQARRASLPKDENGYELKLPSDFQAPAGMKFEIDPNDPLWSVARKAALARGISQDEFSDFAGVYAASKIAEAQRTNTMIQRNRDALGSTVDQRLGAIETWMLARAGDKAKPFVAALKAYPVAETVEAFESLMSQFSRQGSTPMNGGGRDQPNNEGKIPGYENMSFAERRMAQMGPQLQKAASGGR